MSSKEKRVNFSVRCFGYPGTNDGNPGYYAVCVDLNLVTWRSTPQEAKKSLEDAIGGYLETVAKLSEQGVDWRTLIPRPAPLWPYRVMYRFVALRKVFSRTPRQQNLRRQDQYLFDETVDLPSGLMAA